jgi:Fe/S biogenesis protein NfuA
MLTLTETARRTVLQLMESGVADEPALRLAMTPDCSPLAPEYELSLVELTDRSDAELVVEVSGLTVLVGEDHAGALDGASVDFVDTDGGFLVRLASRAAGDAAGPLAERVRQVIDERINPAVASHGGRIGLVAVEGDAVYIEMSGGCQGCGMARVTLRQGVERMIREEVPEVGEIHDVTDHAGGANPYYARG